MFITLTLGRCSILSLGGAALWQFPEPPTADLAALLPWLNAEVLLSTPQRGLGDAVLFCFLDQLIAFDRPRLQTFKQELFRLPLGGMPACRRHGLIGRDLDVLRMPHDERRLDVLPAFLVAANRLHAYAVAQCFFVRTEIVLGFDEQLAFLVFGIIKHGVDMPCRSHPGEAVTDAQQGGLYVVLLV